MPAKKPLSPRAPGSTPCGKERMRYHSCRNRHCPTCQHLPRERWLAARKSELLPTACFHVVFTMPHELNPIVLKHKEPMLNLLFAAVSETLRVVTFKCSERLRDPSESHFRIISEMARL